MIYSCLYADKAKGGLVTSNTLSLDISDIDNTWNYFYAGYSHS